MLVPIGTGDRHDFDQCEIESSVDESCLSPRSTQGAAPMRLPRTIETSLRAISSSLLMTRNQYIPWLCAANNETPRHSGNPASAECADPATRSILPSARVRYAASTGKRQLEAGVDSFVSQATELNRGDCWEVRVGDEVRDSDSHVGQRVELPRSERITPRSDRRRSRRHPRARRIRTLRCQYAGTSSGWG